MSWQDILQKKSKSRRKKSSKRAKKKAAEIVSPIKNKTLVITKFVAGMISGLPLMLVVL